MTAGAPHLLLALALACFAAGPDSSDAAETTAKPQRIVSLNLCTDELVLRLADPSAIASVTWLSRDPRNANMAALAATIPANHGLVEEVLALKPDLVVAGAYTTRSTVGLLKRVGARLQEFDAPRDLAGVRAQISEMAQLMGEPERGQSLIAAMDARLAALAQHQPSRRLKALVLRPNGFTVGRGSLVDEILTRAGFVNLAADLGIDNYGQIALETVALGGADVLVLNTTPDGPLSLAHEILHHPVLAKLGDRLRLVALPSKLWTCAGPAVVDAIELLMDAVAAPADKRSRP